MYSHFRCDRPHARKDAVEARNTLSGATRPIARSKRPHTVAAAWTEICCPTMDRAKV